MDDLFVNQVHCASFEDFLPMFPEKSVQLVVTSPPYEDMKEYRNEQKRVEVNNLRGDSFIRFYWYRLFILLRPVMCDSGIVVVVINDKLKDGVLSPTNLLGTVEVLKQGWFLVERIPWIKTKALGRPAKGRLQDWWEPIYCFSPTGTYKSYPERIRGEYSDASYKRYALPNKKLGEMKTRSLSSAKDVTEERMVELNEKGKLHPNVLILSSDVRRHLNHPARFPVDLARFFITLYTDKGDLVLDPMCGSGTTLCAAQWTGRKFSGCDLVKDYVDMTRNELPKFKEQLDMFDNFYVEPFVCEVPKEPDETQMEIEI